MKLIMTHALHYTVLRQLVLPCPLAALQQLCRILSAWQVSVALAQPPLQHCMSPCSLYLAPSAQPTVCICHGHAVLASGSKQFKSAHAANATQVSLTREYGSLEDFLRFPLTSFLTFLGM